MARLPAILDSQLEEDEGLSYFDYMMAAMLSEKEERRIDGGLPGTLPASLSRTRGDAAR